MAIKPKPKRKKAPSQPKVNEWVNQLAKSNQQSYEQLLREVSAVRQEISEVKEMLDGLKERPRRRTRLFSRRPSKRVSSVPETQRQTAANLPVEQLAPLMPQLRALLPQVNQSNLAEVLKNPALSGLLKQFMQQHKQ
ncbi:hypothetical protein [Brevibacillus fulvus]|uniref:Uncharacterized protein n=1 Tax=Brevibacillus fulvus TaxID=1125967 RepID=A0A938Y1H7_9BACL|nr:hypothetical protein [Brevibacillus fulvus]MBM7591611.1 hypothetical protein [Brevibacillus fulvus]